LINYDSASIGSRQMPKKCTRVADRAFHDGKSLGRNRVILVVTPLNHNPIVNDSNPYKATHLDTLLEKPLPLKTRDRRQGPAIFIAIGALIGGIAGAPLLRNENLLGFLGVLPGCLIAGFIYRLRSSNWPVDETAYYRRYGYAILVTVLLPLMTAISTGMRGQGREMTILALVIGISIATGILVSGDRRSGTVA
jgi:hypothetical protein